MSRCGKSMTTTRKLGVAMFAAILLPLAASAAAEESKDREPNTLIVEAAEPVEELATERIILGVDCTKPLTVSLPDDVLIECETQ